MKRILIICLSFIVACQNNEQNSTEIISTTEKDSIEITKLILGLYHWQEEDKKYQHDFELIIENSFQVGVDMNSVNNALSEIQKTEFFTQNFLSNYKEIADRLDQVYKLSETKYYNEINFAYQDAVPWTNLQDDIGEYFEVFTFSGLEINGDSAIVFWSLKGPYPTDPYKVVLKRIDNIWKIDYLEGFDPSNYPYPIDKIWVKVDKLERGMTINDVKSLYNGYDFIEEPLHLYGIDSEDQGLVVIDNEEKLFIVWIMQGKEKIRGIEIVSPKITIDNDVQIGMTYKEFKRKYPHAKIELDMLDYNYEYLYIDEFKYMVKFMTSDSTRIGRYNDKYELLEVINTDAEIKMISVNYE